MSQEISKFISKTELKIMGSFAERLRKIRESRNLSQRAIALGTGLSPAQISRYESGERTPTEDAIRRIAQFLGVSADYLLGLTDDPTPKSGELPEFLKEKLSKMEQMKEEKLSVKLHHLADELHKLAKKVEEFE